MRLPRRPRRRAKRDSERPSAPASEGGARRAKSERVREAGGTALSDSWAMVGRGLGGVLRALTALARGLFAVLRDLLTIFFDLAGAAARRLAGPLRSAAATIAAAIDAAARALTPVRALTIVIAAALVLLIVGEFVDYRAVEVGAEPYEEVKEVVGAGQVEREITGEAHAFAMVPIAIAGLAALFLSLRGRWRLSRLIALTGALALAVSLLLTAPNGLDEGRAGVAYAGANAILVEGFWVQIAASVTILVCSPALASALRRARPSPRRGRRASGSAATGPVPDAPGAAGAGA